MPFQYESTVNPWLKTIGEQLGEPGRIEANRAIQVGQAQARAAEASGQAYSGAMQQLGQLPGQVIQQQQAAKEQQAKLALQGQQLAAGKLQLDSAQQLATAKQQISNLMNNPDVLNEDGTINLKTIAGKLSGSQAAPDVAGPNQPPVDTSLLYSIVDPINESILKSRKTQQAAADEKANTFAHLANGVLKMGGADGNFMPHAQIAIAAAMKSGMLSPDDANKLLVPMVEHPEQTPQMLQSLIDAVPKQFKDVPESDSVLDQFGNTIKTGTPKPGEGQHVINGQLVGPDGKPIGAQVPKQAEPAKVGSPEDFINTYAKEKFNKPAASLSVAEKSEALGAFKSANADQDLRDAALAQKNIAASLAQLQLNQAPTKDQAASVADDLVHHRISPEQLVSLFSTRGREGLAFKLAVTAEAKKISPDFNFEQASSEYQLAKSPTFQSTVRYMDSTLESMPQLLKNAQALDNGNVRSLNALINAGKNQFNNVDLKKFKTDAVLVGDEVAKILSGGGTGSATSDAKLKQGMDLLGQTDSPKAIAATLQEIQGLIGNRRRALTRGTYMEGSAAVQPPGQGGGSVTVNGFTFPSQAAADGYKKEMGIK